MVREVAARIALCVTIVAVIPSAVQSQPAPANSVRWSAAVIDAMSLAPQPRAYRLFHTTEEIVVVLTFFNDSTSALLLNLAQFSSAARVRVRAPDEIMIQMHWEPSIRLGKGAATSFSLKEQFRLAAKTGFEWRVGVRQPGGRPFIPGAYELYVSLEDAFRLLMTSEGTARIGQVVPNTTLHLTIAPPVTPGEQAAAYRVRAMSALAEDRGVDAVSLFTLALGVSPNDPELAAGLGNAYLTLNRYPEAIAAYERALPGMPGTHSGVPALLALAYVATGDEPNAIRILRHAGKSDSEISAEIRSLRDRIQRRGSRP